MAYDNKKPEDSLCLVEMVEIARLVDTWAPVVHVNKGHSQLDYYGKTGNCEVTMSYVIAKGPFYRAKKEGMLDKRTQIEIDHINGLYAILVSHKSGQALGSSGTFESIMERHDLEDLSVLYDRVFREDKEREIKKRAQPRVDALKEARALLKK